MPANLDIADDVKNGILVSASREEMNVEILTMKQKSEEILKSVEYHKKFLSSVRADALCFKPRGCSKATTRKGNIGLEKSNVGNEPEYG